MLNCTFESFKKSRVTTNVICDCKEIDDFDKISDKREPKWPHLSKTETQ